MKFLILSISLVMLAMISQAQEIKKIKIGDLEKVIRESKTPLIVNFWATYCLPCIEEIPWFQEVVAAHKSDSIQLLLVSVDFKDDYSKVATVAAQRKFTAPVLWLNETNADYFCPRVDPKWSGNIPATLLVNNATGKRLFFSDQVSKPQLEKALSAISVQ